MLLLTHCPKIAPFLAIAFFLLPIDRADAQSYLPQFDTVMDAQHHCPGDMIERIKTQETVRQFKGEHKTPDGGGYVCRQEAINAGYGGLVTHIQPLTKP